MKGHGKKAMLLTAAATVLAVALAGCAIGAAAVSTPTVSKGVITAKGSIYVNGVEYTDTSASISVGGAANHTDADLKVGMVVEVKGSSDGTGKGVASDIIYAANVEGTIDASPAIDAATGVFYIFGHKIATDPTTVFDGVTGVSGLAAGDRVEVSGIASAGVLNASRVEKLSIAGNFKIRGVVSGLPANPFTLTNEDGTSVTVNVTSGTLDPAIVNNSKVIVEFTAWATPLLVTADKVHLVGELQAEDNSRAEVSGIVSGFVAGPPATFTVDGMNVSADAAIAAGVANGVRVEVQGTMTAGVLVAEKVHVAHESTIEAEGTATAVDAVAGTIALDGITFTVTGTTIYRDESNAAIEHFGLANIAVNDSLQVKGYVDPTTNTVMATRVERNQGSASTQLSAPVTAVGASTLTMAGITVDISTLTNKATLLALPLGTTVVVQGSVSGGIFHATSGVQDD
jgi:hypothetical protein